MARVAPRWAKCNCSSSGGDSAACNKCGSGQPTAKSRRGKEQLNFSATIPTLQVGGPRRLLQRVELVRGPHPKPNLVANQVVVARNKKKESAGSAELG
ncbi:unnamed protein product [Linum trigynum]|uniref:Uncharacterized protein n=1 Tax=Linum trigynum TaxID=586398 RepID=A0AAV2CKR2_9ROSI